MLRFVPAYFMLYVVREKLCRTCSFCASTVPLIFVCIRCLSLSCKQRASCVLSLYYTNNALLIPLGYRLSPLVLDVCETPASDYHCSSWWCYRAI